MANILRVPTAPPVIQTIPMAPSAIRARPIIFCDVKASLRIAAARIATIRGITPGKRAPPWAAGAKSKPRLTRRTMGAPQPKIIATRPIQPSRSSASPLRMTYGNNSAPATVKRMAVTSHGVRVVLTPRRETTMNAAQMHTAARP